MSLYDYERNNSIKADVDFYDTNNNLVDPSGNKTYINVIKSNGTYLVGNITSGARVSRTGLGNYEYYFNTIPTDPLGIYVIEWTAYHNLGIIDGINYGTMKLTQRDAVNIVHTEHP